MLQLYGYKRCSTCRNAQRTLESNGATVEFLDIIDSPPAAEMIREWLRITGRPVLDLVNTKGTVFRTRGMKDTRLTEDEWIKELSQDGKLLRRPILVTSSGEVYIGYEEDTYRRLSTSNL